MEQSGDEHGREAGDQHVVVAHHGIVIPTRVLQRIFEIHQRLLQFEKMLIGLQVGIVLHNGHEVDGGGGERQFVFAAVGNRPAIGRRDRALPESNAEKKLNSVLIYAEMMQGLELKVF